MEKRKITEGYLKQQQAEIDRNGSDLAVEAHSIAVKNLNAAMSRQVDEVTEIEGVSVEERRNANIKITHVRVLNEEGEKATGKPKGNYYTFEAEDLLCLIEDGDVMALVDEVKQTFTKLIGEDKKNIFIIGLGNRRVTPDALGPKVVEGLYVSRHIKHFLPPEEAEKIKNVSAITPGVLGITGIETMEIVKAVSDELLPDYVVAIDALAANSPSRIGTTLQICDTGISPGAGVKNTRKELTEHTLGVPVIAVGMPTVIDASGMTDDKFRGFMVTPKEIDSIIEDTAEVISKAINIAFGLDAIYN